MGRIGRSILLAILLAVTLSACGDGSGARDDATVRSTGEPVGGSDTAAASDGVARNDATGTASLPPGMVIATPGEPDTRRNEPEPTAGPPPTQPPPIHSSYDSDGNGFYTSAEFIQAIRGRYASYAWPDAYYISADAIIERLSGMLDANMQHEVPGEYTVLGRWHQCAWGLEFLDAFAAGDNAMMAKSLAQLRWGLDINPLMPPETADQLRNMYDKAELGDVASLQQSVNVNCDASAFSPRPPATP